jgi:GTP cyclohydrolase II
MALMEDSAIDPGATNATLRDVDRALAEMRRGAPVLLIAAPDMVAVVQAAETASDAGLAELERLSGHEPILLLTARRGAALGLELSDTHSRQGVVALTLSGRDAKRVVELADPAAWKGEQLRRRIAVETPDMLAQAAIDLAKLARLLPAAVLSPLSMAAKGAPEAWAADHGILAVHCDDVGIYRLSAARALFKVAEARVPLKGAENTRVIAFRPDDGGSEHMALVIGKPDPDAPVLLRIHSECFTGDLLNSLRCDCGDQLRGAIEAIGAAGAGLVLYLTQEGRGIGLVNKLRAYALQDQGADTAEANETLGFDADERVYLPAAEMLRQLGYRRVRLMTNNPEKVEGLRRLGVEVTERVSHSFPSNGHNDFYLATKARRFGHIL